MMAESAVHVDLAIDTSALGNTIEPSFTGLSYEQAQMQNPAFFAGTNKQLVGFFKTLGSQGVLRIGGNTSAMTFWSPNAKPSKADMHLTSGPNRGRHRLRPMMITPDSVRRLADFLDSTGWTLIYGLNLRHGKPENVADEAAFVMETIGDRVVAFQLGNEPDLFARGIYTVDDYMRQWAQFYKAIRARVPNAPFAGPDTAGIVSWLMPFAQRFKQEVKFISSHYYAEGPPTNPAMTIARLLEPNPRLEKEIAAAKQVREATGLKFRLTETNSCYQGGKRGVSNAFASALWAGDLMFQEAATGSIGINFHGGGYGWYAPIVGTNEAGFLARPEYYGMLLFAQAGPGRLVGAKLSNAEQAPLLTAYAVRGENGRVHVALFNKNLDKDVVVSISGSGGASATALRLEAPRASDANDVTFGGSPVGIDGRWFPQVEEHVPGRNGLYTLPMRKATGALVKFA